MSPRREFLMTLAQHPAIKELVTKVLGAFNDAIQQGCTRTMLRVGNYDEPHYEEPHCLSATLVLREIHGLQVVYQKHDEPWVVTL